MRCTSIGIDSFHLGRQERPRRSQTEKVNVCRAGDAIIIEQGDKDQLVHVAQDVVISWPLQLIGAGSTADDTVLESSKGAEAVLDFR